MKQTKYLLAGAFLAAVIVPANAADPRGVPVMPRVIYAAPVVLEPTVMTIEPVVQNFIVDQGPYYSGPNLMEFPKRIFHEDRPIRAYPYVRTWEAAHYVPEPVYRQPPRVLRYQRPISRLN